MQSAGFLSCTLVAIVAGLGPGLAEEPGEDLIGESVVRPAERRREDLVDVDAMEQLFRATKDAIVERGNWSIVQVVLNQGTRAERVVRKLRYRDREVRPTKDHVLTTPFGPLLAVPYRLGSFGACGWKPATTATRNGIPARLDQQTRHYWTTRPESP